VNLVEFANTDPCLTETGSYFTGIKLTNTTLITQVHLMPMSKRGALYSYSPIHLNSVVPRYRQHPFLITYTVKKKNALAKQVL